jgi:outer membrane protein assembly factor BamB
MQPQSRRGTETFFGRLRSSFLRGSAPLRLFLVLVFGGVLPAAEADETPAHAWPSFRGPGGLGVASHKNAPLSWNGKTGENVRWKVPIPRAGTNSPVVWGNRIFLSGSDDETREVYAFDMETGGRVWTAAVGAKGGPVPRVSADATLSASTLATDGERVVAIFATGDIAAFGRDGAPLWSRNLGVPKNAYGYASSLLCHDGRVLVQYDNEKGRFLALDARTGKTLWDRPREVKISWASPALVQTGSRWEALLNAPPFVMGHDPATGETLWKVRWLADDDPVEVAPSPAYANGIAFVVTERAKLVALRLGREEPRMLWSYEEDLPDVSSPVATNKFVLMASSGGKVTCLHALTGKVAWSKQFDEGFYSSPVVVGDRCYLMDKKGLTVVFRLGAPYEELARNELGEDSGCTPAFPEGRVILRTEKHLYAVGKR